MRKLIEFLPGAVARTERIPAAFAINQIAYLRHLWHHKNLLLIPAIRYSYIFILANNPELHIGTNEAFYI